MKEETKQLYLNHKLKAKRKCIASLLCIPIWMIFTNVGKYVEGVGGNWLTIGDVWGLIILVCIAVVYADRGAKIGLILKKARLLENKTKLTVTLENVFHAHKDYKDSMEIARLVKNHIAHLGKVEVVYETPMDKKKI